MSNITRRRLLAASAALATTLPSPLARAQAPSSASLPQRGAVLIRNATLLTMDPTLGDIVGGDVLVRGGAIVAVGRGLAAPDAEVIDATGMIVLPGLVDTHWHMWGSVARNMAGDDAKTGYYLFARAVGGVFTPEDNARGVRLSLAEAIHSGITTVHNWSHNLPTPAFADAEIAAHAASGGRALFGYGYAGVGMTDQTINLADIPRVHGQYFAKGGGGLLTLGIASRGPESNSLELCRREWDVARKLGLKISTHMGTSAPRVKARQGVKVLADAGLLGPDVILIHETNTSPENLDAIARTKTFVSMSPFTEMRTGFGIPPVLAMLERGIGVSLSVDTIVLAGNADMFAIMKAMQNVGDGTKPSEFALPARRVLEMATIEGARALGLGDTIGSLVPGKRADLICIDTNALNLGPASDPVRMVVQSAQPANVDTVMVDGRILKRGGKLLHVDTRKLLTDAADTMGRVRAEVSRMLEKGEVSVVR